MKKYLFFIISCLVVHNVSAKTIYVDNQLSADCTSGEYSIANRNSSGSDGNAYITIQSGVDNLNAGDCLLVREGLYKENAYLSKSGTVNKWITIKNYPGEMPHIDGERQRNAGLSGSTLHYIRIEGFYLTGHKYKGIDIGWEGTCTHIEVRYIIGDDNAQSAVVLNNSDDSIIEYCIALRNGSWGASWSSGINLFIPKGVNNIIRNNVSFQNVDISSHLTDGNGFIIDYGEAAGGGIFINNLAFYNGGGGIVITESENATLYNNTCYHNVQDDTSDADIGIYSKHSYKESTPRGGGLELTPKRG